MKLTWMSFACLLASTNLLGHDIQFGYRCFCYEDVKQSIKADMLCPIPSLDYIAIVGQDDSPVIRVTVQLPWSNTWHRLVVAEIADNLVCDRLSCLISTSPPKVYQQLIILDGLDSEHEPCSALFHVPAWLRLVIPTWSTCLDVSWGHQASYQSEVLPEDLLIHEVFRKKDMLPQVYNHIISSNRTTFRF